MKPYGRRVKKEVGEILKNCTRDQALERLREIPDKQLTSHLFAYFYDMEELIKFRSATAMGELALRISGYTMERAKIILRRIMWNLNDESGGIGWGSPEAMGEILSKSPELAADFKSILFSYLDTGGNHIEHEMLQRGVIWGIGTYLSAAPHDLTVELEGQLLGYLNSKDPVKRGYALRALINAESLDCESVPDHIQKDTRAVDIYNGWDFVSTRISDMAHACNGESV